MSGMKFSGMVLALIISTIIFVGLLYLIFFLYGGWNEKLEEKISEKCNEIGYEKYVNLNNEDYCTNNGVDLFRVRFDREQDKFVKVNLYEYGEEK